MRARVRQFTRVVAVLAALLAASAADAASLGRQCRRACADEIAACVAGGGRRLACKKQMLGRCRTEGLGVCQGSGAPAVLAGSCASPTVIASQGGTFTGTTSGTSLLTGSCGSTGTSPEKVFQWTPAVSGTATIQTCGAGTNFDTVLYMRSGLCATGSEVASGCNDDACTNSTGANRASRITPTVTAGQTYFIVVDGYGSSQGNFALTVTPPGVSTTTTTRPPTTTTTLPGGGGCSSPTVIAAQGGTFSSTTSGTSSLAGSCGSTASSPERVYQWTPAVSGTATIQTCGGGTNFDTVLYMRSGACASGSEVVSGCNDDACTNATGLNRASRITPTVTAGQTYFIVVDGYGGAQGTFSLTVTPPGVSTTTTTRPPTTTTIGFTTTTARPPTTTTSTTIFTTSTSLPPPTSLTATAPSCSEVDLRWTLSSGTASGYNVYRKASTATTFTLVKQVGATPVLPVADTAASAATTYTYGVAAWNSAGTSAMPTVLTNTPACAGSPGQFRWAQRLGGLLPDVGYAVATDGSGNVIVGGSFVGSGTLGSRTLTSAGGADAFLVKYTGTGVPVWTNQIGGTGNERIQGMGVDRAGNIVVTGFFQNTVDFGGRSLTSTGGEDIFVAKYTSAGTLVWAQAYGGSRLIDDIGYGVVVDGNGDVLVTGTFAGTMTLGSITIGFANDGTKMFTAKLAGATGVALWATSPVSSSETHGFAIAVDASGNPIVVGSFISGVQFAGQQFGGAGGNDILVAKYTSAGAEVWFRQFGSWNDDVGAGVGVDGNGDVLVTGEFQATVNFGDGPVTALNGSDVFLLKLAGATGNHLWSRTFAGTSYENATGLAVDGSGNVVITGNFSAAEDFGTGTLTSAGSGDIFVAKFRGDGTPLWARDYGSPYNETGNAVAVDPSGNVFATGDFAGTVSFSGGLLGGGLLTSAGSADAFLLSLAP